MVAWALTDGVRVAPKRASNRLFGSCGRESKEEGVVVGGVGRSWVVLARWELSTLVRLAMVVLLCCCTCLIANGEAGSAINGETCSCLMVLIAALFVGAVVTLAGFPEPVNVSAGKR